MNKTKSLKFIFILLFLFYPLFVLAFPSAEKIPSTSLAPLDTLSSQVTGMFVPLTGDFQDKYIITFNSTDLTLIDTRVWLEYHTQPDSFSVSIVGAALLSNGTSLIVALGNGNLARIELDDEDSFEDTDTDDDDDDDDDENDTINDSREIDSSEDMTSAGASGMVTDPNSAVEKVYLINSTNLYYYEYDLTSEKLSVELLLSGAVGSATTTSLTPTDIVFAESTIGDRVIISTEEGVLLITTPGSGSFTEVTLDVREDDTVSPNLAKIALTPDHNFVFVLDTTNFLIWVYSLQNAEFIDPITTGTNLDPIEIDEDDNTSFVDLVTFEDDSDNEVYTYVTGSEGVSVLDATNPLTAESTKIIDINTTVTGDTPITISATPGIITASSEEDRTIYTSNGDASISVITDKAFVSVTDVTPTTVNATTPSFVLTFQSDRTGTYTVRSNANPDGTGGTELISSTTLATADTDTTAASIDINSFDRSAFSEGSNAITVFLTDDTNGFLGRGGIYLTVDRPPETVDITSVNFGNKKALVIFTPSDDNDIAGYTLYAQAAEDQSTPTCPGSLAFDTTLTALVAPSECSADSCGGIINGLTNGTYYCVAIEAVDQSSQSSGINGFGTAVLPEATVGPAGFLGETGCHLEKKSIPNKIGISIFCGGLLFLIFFRSLLKKKQAVLLVLIASFLLSSVSFARDTEIEIGRRAEQTPKHFTFEARAGNWIPTDSGMKNFYSFCCNPIGDIEFGILFNSRYNITAGTGFSYSRGDAVGAITGRTSGDKFTLITVPLRLDFVYRFDFKPEQLIVPFGRIGFDTVVFNESGTSDDIWGTKFGGHAGAGVSILLDRTEGLPAEIEQDMGINDIYLVIEGRYAMINNFNSSGIDFSGFTPSIGVMFSF